MVPLVLSIGAIVFVRPESPSPTAPPPSPTVSTPAHNDGNQLSTLLEADGGEGSIRLEMWSTALERFASSPLFGLGPGTHVPWPHPLSGEISYNEAHNTILDILLVAGSIGLAAALVPVGIVVVKSAQANRLPEAAIAIAPIAVFAMVHYIGRQPLTWIFFAAIVLILSSQPLLRRPQ
ncbi:O-antigen ligase [Devosia sp.]|uniref:O-antigen ligase family protein n=1 Tax=Devosia sp. TaxID=1871048 RepID=UPI0025E2A608|nr:O-antigen ligase family protein [Devosia sp.]MCR6636427.1 O-antigen ligase family protein [Devosia sp.]